MGNNKTIMDILKRKYVLVVIIVTLFAIGLVVYNEHYQKNVDTEYKEWQSQYSALPDSVDYDKYSDVAVCMADVEIGVEISSDKINMLKSTLPEAVFNKVQSKLNVERIGEVEQSDKSVEEQMDKLFGGQDEEDDDKYNMYVLHQNYYHPDVYVYKLINKNNNCVIVTIYTNEVGGVDDAKTSL